MENISKLMTEQSNVRSNNIETQSVKDILIYMNDENQMITNAIEKCIPSIEQVTNAVIESFVERWATHLYRERVLQED